MTVLLIHAGVCDSRQWERQVALLSPRAVVAPDRDFHELGARLAAEIPGARLVTIPEAGHLPNLETPEAFDRLLLEFLED